MKCWPWRRRADARPRSEATEARERAEQELDRTVEETKRYEALGESLREIRERNHLSDAFLELIHGRS